MTDFVAGFLFSEDKSKVVLVKKNKPEWQAGKYNGVGGKIEHGEYPSAAMHREFLEETGHSVHNWKHFANVSGLWGRVWFFRATGDVEQVRTVEEEEIVIMGVSDLLVSLALDTEIKQYPSLPNLSWLVPLALYTHDEYLPINATEI